MDKCSKCETKSKFVWNVQGALYCKRCHPITKRLISLLNGKAIDRSRLPTDLHEYFSGVYLTPPSYSDNERGCRRCKQKARHYTWYDNNYPSRIYAY
jgi:hypothetical protein